MLLDFLSALEPLRRLELPVVALKHRKVAVTLAQAQNPAPAMLDHASRLEPHLEPDSADTTAFGDSGLRLIMATHFSDVANQSDRPLPHR